MADYPLGGRQIARGFLGLLADGLLKSDKLVDRKYDQERLQQHDRLSQASVEIIVVRIHLVPKLLGVDRDTIREVIGCHAEIFAQILDHLFQCADFLEEL
jgi:hypothetical protein